MVGNTAGPRKGASTAAPSPAGSSRRGRFRRPANPGLWRALVPVIALLAGLLAATTATTARGTDLRSAGRNDLTDLIRQAQTRVASQDNLVRQLQREVAAATDRSARSDERIAAIKARAQPLLVPAGLVAMTGPGLTVILDDAHPAEPETDPAKANALVVHQSDMQAAVNALWAGGAEAIRVMDQRLSPTSAVRCVGNTLLLNGRVYSPPFVISAIGPATGMRIALNESIALQQYRKDADAYGLGYQVDEHDKIEAPAYDAPIGLSYAAVGG
ncbi:MAG TPA: DUF881 domain-containing protein [Jatrophihabitans sp.]|jgi:uncharacterized protein YlxW (UPF0749 family)|uniref:DUF881 domain-containing protein n=1 Tax=Jatrophihabitans sp. TaxID=1932789 RepID=UPI002EF278EB